MALITLIPVAPAHASDVQRLASDPRVATTTNLPEPYPPDGAASFIAFIAPRHASGAEYAFAVFAAADGHGADAPHDTLVGMCGLVMPDDAGAAGAVAELGYWIGVPWWGRGYATAACRAAVSFAFAETPVAAVDAYPLADNAASRRVLEKAGATCLGDVPNKYPKWTRERLLAQYRFVRAASAR